ncbi:MAG: hypothetical protein L6R39_005333 [Caloplaca ligustica]|nr:MAG: hypothetical protein L6R39_005333 [Caloplaca ligustica]
MQSLTIGRSKDEDYAFVKLSLPWSFPTTTTSTADLSPIDLIAANIASLTLSTKDPKSDPLFLCAAADCPLEEHIHTQGFFMTSPTRGIIWHEDFGFSDPPADIWAAYFRYTRYRKEIGDHCRSVDDFIDVLIHRPFDDERPQDAAVVLNFLRYHAVTLQQGEGRVEVVPLRGRVLNAVEPEVVGGLSSLRL